MHHALAAERHQLRLGVAPCAQPGRPRLHAAKIEQLRARLDDTAVRVADDHRRNLTRGHGDHRLVEQRQAWPRLAEVDERTPLADPGQRDQIGVTEPCAKLSGGRELVLRAGRVSAEDRLKRIRIAAISLLDTVRAALEEPADAGDPTAALWHVAGVQQPEGQPERTPDRPLRFVSPLVDVERASPGLIARGIGA